MIKKAVGVIIYKVSDKIKKKNCYERQEIRMFLN